MIYKHNGSIITDIGGKWLTGDSSPVDPYNPLNLPPYTVRVRTNDGNVPIKGEYTSYDSATLVFGTTDTYDVYKNSTDFKYLLRGSTNVIEVLGANTSDVTEMSQMFYDCTSLSTVALFDTSNVRYMIYMFKNCTSLQSVPLFDTSKVTWMDSMFYNCTSLTTVPLFNTSNVTEMIDMFSYCRSLSTVPLFNTSNVTYMGSMFARCSSLTNIPLFDTSKVTSMNNMFVDCKSVQSGALALYQQASTQANPPSSHSLTFRNCGINTQTGAAELAQIPSDWK